MTVEELKKALEDVPDNFQVIVSSPGEEISWPAEDTWESIEKGYFEIIAAEE